MIGAGLLGVGAYAVYKRTDGCLWRCGKSTHCVEKLCVAVEAPLPSPPEKRDEKKRRRRAPLDGAAPAVTLQPGDERMVSQGDTLGRPQKIDFSKGGDDGRELSQDELDGIFKGAHPAITRCMTDAVADAPLETGKVEVGVRVGEGGDVQKIRVEGPALLMRRGLYKCVRGAVQALHFPKSGGASVVTWPFELK